MDLHRFDYFAVAEAHKKVKELCKEFGFTAGMLKGVLAEGRKKK